SGYLNKTVHGALPGAIQKYLGAEHIGANEFVGRKNASVDMGLSRKIYDRIHSVTECCEHRGLIGNVAFDEAISRLVKTLKIVEISGVGERVEIDQLGGRPGLESQPDKG